MKATYKPEKHRKSDLKDLKSDLKHRGSDLTNSEIILKRVS